MNNLLFLPVDINLCISRFLQKEDSEKNNYFNPWWNSTFINEDSIQKNNFNKILNQLPFTKITRLFYKTQKTAVGRHVDVMPQMILEKDEYNHIRFNEPCGYRIVLNGGLDKLKIYSSNQCITAVLPSIPICYLINSSQLYHSVESDINRETIYIRGFLDLEKHKLLISKSLEKYKEYALYE